ncbi:MFS general substrate transporter [Meredithblackwellia eburnea MCA 4105]
MRVDQQLALTETSAVTAAELEEHSLKHVSSGSDVHAGEKQLDLTKEPSLDEQEGVKQLDGITRSWSKNSLRTLYIFFWLTYCTNAFRSSITYNLNPYILSSFAEHSLIPIISIVSSVMSGAAYMVIAKVLNIFDRSYGFIGMATFATLGLILSAACKNIATYCAAQVFLDVGFIGIIFSVDVLTSDTSQLKNRGLAFAFTASPYIITAYSGPVIAQKFYENNWRWAFGAFAIILPVVALPMFAFLQIQKRNAIKAGTLKVTSSRRTLLESFRYYVVEFDLLGVFLICAGMVIFLLGFSIASYYSKSFGSAQIVSMIVVGIVCLGIFTIYELRFSPKPFIPARLLVNRTVLGACMLGFSWQIAYYCWASYFSSYLQVVFNLSITTSGYIASIYDVVATLWLIPTGYLIRRTGYFKWVVLVSVPIYTLGEGLMIYLRQPNRPIGGIVVCQILIAIGGSAFTCVQQVAVLAAGEHNDAAAMLALLGLFGYFGGACGGAISAAIWGFTLPSALQSHLPEDTLELWADIYSSLEVQLSYPIGDPTRIAIQEAYAIAQTRMLIAGTSIMALSLISILLIKNINVAEIKQVRGVLF